MERYLETDETEPEAGKGEELQGAGQEEVEQGQGEELTGQEVAMQGARQEVAEDTNPPKAPPRYKRKVTQQGMKNLRLSGSEEAEEMPMHQNDILFNMDSGVAEDNKVLKGRQTCFTPKMNETLH